MPSNFVATGTDGYDAVMGRWSRRLAFPFLKFAGVPARGRVLDAGCGTGSLTLALANHSGLDVIEALDLEESFVEALRNRTSDPRIRVSRGDVCALSQKDASLDAAYSLLVLHFVPDASRALAEMRRVLRAGGVAGAAVWAHGGMPSWRLFWDTVRTVEPDAVGAGLVPGKRPLTGEGELRTAFEIAGFSDVIETQLRVSVSYSDFEDFWYPMVYGQGNFGKYFDRLPVIRRGRLEEAVRAAYLADGKDACREFTNIACAVRGIA